MTIICACAVCREDIREGQPMADHKVYKLGDLAYIELAHLECGRGENSAIKLAGRPAYWEHD